MNKRAKLFLIVTLLLGVLMGALDISIVGPALPPIARSFMLQENELSWIFSIYVLFNIVFINPFTRLSDKLGRRTAYLFAILLFGSGSALCAAADSYNMLLVGRAIQGIGSAGIFPVASAIIGDVIEVEKRGRYLGILGSMFGIAFIIGPIIAGVMLKSLTWNYLFIVNIPISLLLLTLALLFIPNYKAEKGINRGTDISGVVLLGFTLTLLTLGMSMLSAFPIVSMGAIAASLLLAAVWYRHERSTLHASINVSLFSNKQISRALIVGFGAGVFQAAFVFFPKFLVSNFSVSASEAGFMLLPLVVGTALGAPISGRIVDKYGARPVVTAALLLVGTGFTIQSLKIEVPLFYAGSTLIGFGLAMLVGSSLRYIVLNETDSKDRASAQGIMAIAISVGQIIGSSLIGIAISTTGEYRPVFVTIAVLSYLLLFVSSSLKKRVALP